MYILYVKILQRMQRTHICPNNNFEKINTFKKMQSIYILRKITH